MELLSVFVVNNILIQVGSHTLEVIKPNSPFFLLNYREEGFSQKKEEDF